MTAQITGLYVDEHGNLKQPGNNSPIWGMGIPVRYRGVEPDESDIWAIGKSFFTNIAIDKFKQGTHPDDPF